MAQAAETAHFNVSSAGCSACMLFPVPDVSDPPLPSQLVLPGGKAVPVGPPLFNFKALQLWVLRCAARADLGSACTTGRLGCMAARISNSTGEDKALVLHLPGVWGTITCTHIVSVPACGPLVWRARDLGRCCQQLRGGLKDKPGKPPDYYHTCYCLSGLSQAQHASNAVLGPRENLLKRADPLLNVVEDKLEAARKYFAAHPLAAAPPQGDAAGAAAGGAGERGSGVPRGASASSSENMGGSSVGTRSTGRMMDLDP